jgi:hypothetical protein
MSALTLANIPSSINTYERLAMWVTQCLQSTSAGADLIVSQGAAAQPVANCQIATTADGVNRAICVIYLPVDYPALNSPTAKTWMAAQEFNQATPHTNLLSN